VAAVRLDAMLREFGPGGTLTTPASSVGALLEELETRYPRLQYRLRDETGAVRKFVRVFVNGKAVEGASGLATPIGPTDRVDILHSIQGG